MAFLGGKAEKNLPANPGDTRDEGLIPGSGRSPREENGNHSNVLAWRIPWTEEPVSYSSWGLKESCTTEHTHTMK